MAEKRATAVWTGNLTEGSGVVSSESGVLVNQALTWKVRTGASEGKTSPEELIAAAHASCFSMALSYELQNAGFTAEKLEVTSVVTFGPKPEGGMKIQSSALTLVGTVPGIGAEQFAEIANGAKLGCPVSGALAGNVEITLEATLA
ncbi:MAG: OsmC family peroxiredoxin [Thermomicrobiales bacterium]